MMNLFEAKDFISFIRMASKNEPVPTRTFLDRVIKKAEEASFNASGKTRDEILREISLLKTLKRELFR
jgi:hypothetical protein